MKFYYLLAFIGVSFTALAQPGPMPATLQLKGKVADAESGFSVSYASITLKSLRDTTFITGGLADSAGSFHITDLRPGRYQLRASFIGYSSYYDTVLLTPQNPINDLGTLLIKPKDMDAGEGVVVEATQDNFRLGIDRKIFTVDDNPVVEGGTAMDVMRMVPTVNVDGEGNISLRGSENFMIFINGKPSGLTAQNRQQVLDQMPAANIERIEIITNPSAKYDAEGVTGIINIVTKKQDDSRKRYTSITGGIGNRNKFNASATTGWSNPKHNTSLTAGYRYNNFYFHGHNIRDNLEGGSVMSTISQRTFSDMINQGGSFSASTDRFLSNKRILSLTLNSGFGSRSRPETIRFGIFDGQGNTLSRFQRYAPSENMNLNADLGLTYSGRMGKDDKHEWSWGSNYSIVTRREVTDIEQRDIMNGEMLSNARLVQNNTENRLNTISVAQHDRVYNLPDKLTLETGAKITWRSYASDFYADSMEMATGIRHQNEAISNIFYYDDVIPAVYISGRKELNAKWGTQVGVRSEYTWARGIQERGGLDFQRSYINFFPSAYLTYKYNQTGTAQIAYSTRINRPSMWHLNPFTDFSDPLNLRMGNPELQPEIFYSLELSAQQYIRKHTVTATLFGRHADNAFQWFRHITDSGVAIVQPINVGFARHLGGELVLRSSPFKNYTATNNINIFHNTIEGRTQLGTVIRQNLMYSFKHISTYSVSRVFSVVGSFDYRGPNIISQGIVRSMYGADLGGRYELPGGNWSIGANVQDIFNTRRFMVVTEDFNYAAETYRKRETRWVMVNLTWKIGQQAQQQQRRRGQQNGDGGGFDDGGM